MIMERTGTLNHRQLRACVMAVETFDGLDLRLTQTWVKFAWYWSWGSAHMVARDQHAMRSSRRGRPGSSS